MNKGSDGQELNGEGEHPFYTLQLFVAGTSPMSVRAIQNLKAILERHLSGKYDLDIIDIHQVPASAQQADIAAVPLLIKELPSPRRRLIGDMSDTSKVLGGLGLNIQDADEE